MQMAEGSHIVDNHPLISFIIAAAGLLLCVSSCDKGQKKAEEVPAPPAAAVSAPVVPAADPGAPQGQAKNTPGIVLLNVLPLFPRKADELTVQVEAAGNAGAPVYFSYQWSVNDNPLIFETSPSLKNAFVSRDRVTVEIIPEAMGVRGMPVTKTVIIGNTPPVVKAELGDVTVEGKRYTCRVQAEDPDGGPLVYTILDGPKSMTIDGHTGVITGEYQQADAGKHTLSVSVKDADNAEVVLTVPFQLGFETSSAVSTTAK